VHKEKDDATSQPATSTGLKTPYWLRIRINDTHVHFEYANNTASPVEDNWTNLYTEAWDISTSITDKYYVFLTAYNTPTTSPQHVDNFEIVENPLKADFINDPA